MAETIHFTKSYFLKFRHLRKEICTCFSISIFRLTRKYGFLINSLRWPLKMVRCLLDPENHANQEVQKSSHVQEHLWNGPGHLGYAYLKCHQVSERCPFIEHVPCHSVITMIEFVGLLRPKRSWMQGWWSRGLFTVYAQRRREQCLTEGLRFRCSGHQAHPGEQSPREGAQDLQSSWWVHPIQELSLPHWDDPHCPCDAEKRTNSHWKRRLF